MRFTTVYGIFGLISNASSSTAGDYTEGVIGATYNDLDRSTSGYSLDARQGKALNDAKAAKTQFLAISTAISIPAAGASKSYTVTDMTSSHQLVRWNFSSNSENNPPTSLQWTTGSGTFTIKNTGSTSPSQTVKPLFVYPATRTATASS